MEKTGNTENTALKTQVYNLVILDKSGSMESIRKEAIDGYNETLGTIRAAQLKHLEGFLAGVMKKLSNEKFVNGAPAAVVENERKKQADAEAKIKAIDEQIKALS